MGVVRDVFLSSDFIRLAERQATALERIATALEMIYPPILDYSTSSPDDGTVDMAADDTSQTESEREESERVQSKRDREESIAIAAGSDSF